MPKILEEAHRVSRPGKKEARGDASCSPGYEEEASCLNPIMRGNIYFAFLGK